MADADFEARLLRLYDQPPAMPDADLFARRVEARLDRGWGLRRLLIGAAGLAGGVIGAVQMVRSGLAPQVEAASEQSAIAMTRGLDDLLGHMSLPLGGEVMWMAAALGVMALALAVARAVEEF